MWVTVNDILFVLRIITFHKIQSENTRVNVNCI
jgi:hypothetical protein